MVPRMTVIGWRCRQVQRCLQRDFHWSGNVNANSQPLRDAPKRSLISLFARKAEMYPMAIVGAAVVGMLAYAITCYAERVFKFLRRTSTSPFDWEQIRDNYYSRHTTVLDPDGSTHRRLETMEQLKDAMLDASKKSIVKNV